MEYGRICGFDCRRSTERKDKNGNTIEKYFLCSRTRNFDNFTMDDLNVQRKRRTASSKCNCPAKLIIETIYDNGFSLKTFTENTTTHLLAKGGCSSYGVADPLTDFHKKFRMDAAKLNIGATRANAILKSML